MVLQNTAAYELYYIFFSFATLFLEIYLRIATFDIISFFQPEGKLFTKN